MANRWHILREGATLTVTRHLPVRFDVVASARFPRVRRLRLAHQVRQDMWRALQRVRGFSPVVEVTEIRGELTLRAGGRAEKPFNATSIEAKIADLLCDPGLRRRWIAQAAHGMTLVTGEAG